MTVAEQTRVLPRTDHIKVPFVWTEIASLMGVDSCDFSDGWTSVDGICEENLDTKRQDYNYQALLRSISERGMYDPVFWDGKEFGNGHHRLAVCIDLGYTHIPTTDNVYHQWEENGPVKAR